MQTQICAFPFPGVFITHGDVGVGTIVGSAVFNILCIIGVCGLFAGQVCGFSPRMQCHEGQQWEAQGPALAVPLAPCVPSGAR